jgi:hypothetical protein
MKKVTSLSPSSTALTTAADAKNPTLGATAYQQIVDQKAADILQEAVYDLNWAFSSVGDLQANHDNIRPANTARFDADDKEVAPATYSEGQVNDRKEYKRRIGMFEAAITDATTKNCFCKIKQLRGNPDLKEWAKDESATA